MNLHLLLRCSLQEGEERRHTLLIIVCCLRCFKISKIMFFYSPSSIRETSIIKCSYLFLYIIHDLQIHLKILRLLSRPLCAWGGGEQTRERTGWRVYLKILNAYFLYFELKFIFWYISGLLDFYYILYVLSKFLNTFKMFLRKMLRALLKNVYYQI